MVSKRIITIFVHCYPPAKGGLEYLVGEIKKILDIECEVHVITGQGLTLDSYKTFSDLTVDDSNNIHRLELNYFSQKLFNKFFSKIIFKVGYFLPFYFGPILKYTHEIENIIAKSDVIIGTGMPTKMFYDAYLFARKYNKKLVLIPAYHNVSYYNRCSLFQKTFDYASTVLYLTPLEKNQLLLNYRIDTDKLVQATFCPYTQKQLGKQKEMDLEILNKRTENFKRKHITFGFIGQITLRKNLDFFKEYLDKYLSDWENKGYDLKVYLAGAKTNSSVQVETLFKDYLDKNIVSINYGFGNQEKEREYSKIDIFINPSEEESLGIVNFEAIYYGCILLIPEKSAFASLDGEAISTFKSMEALHKNLNLLLSSPKNLDSLLNRQKKVFVTHSQENFQKVLYTILVINKLNI